MERSSQPGEEGLEEISAQDVRKRCLDGQEVVFVKNKVTGSLNLSGELIDHPVRFTGCEFGDSIVLTGARATKGIRLEGCKIHSLYGDRLCVEGDLLLERVSGQGEISLCGARLTGHLRCTGSTFSQPPGKAFNAKGMMLGGSALFDGGFSSEGEFILSLSRIDGTLDMTSGSFSNTVGPALVAEGIRVGTGMFLGANSNFEGTVILTEAHVSGKIKCSGGHFVAPGKMAIDAELIEADGIFLDTNFTATGEVHLDASTVTGKLFCNGGKFCNPGGIALSANGLDCQDVRLGHGFTATGEVSLMGAEISREFNCSGGKFNNEKGVALRADGLICGGKVYLNEKTFHAIGEVILRNARITTELNCSNGTFENSGGNALSAGGLTCEGNVYLNDGFRAAGKVELVNVAVTRELACNGGTFGTLDARGLTAGVLNCDGGTFGTFDAPDLTAGVLACNGGTFATFTAPGLTVRTKFDWKPSQRPERVDISFADVELMRDRPESWPETEGKPIKKKESEKSKLAKLVRFDFRKASEGISEEDRKTRLGGFTFRNVNVDKDVTVDKRIDWLNNARYAPEVYEQLSHIYRQKGLDSDAREIAIAGQQDRRKRGGMPRAPRLWNYFLDITVGYGYKLYRPFLLILIAGLVGTLLFHLAQAHGLMEAVSPPQGKTVSANKCTPDYPCFFPLTYSFELFLPVVNLRQVAYWLPSGTTGWSQALLAWVWVAILAGWIFTAAIAAGIGRLFSQRG